MNKREVLKFLESYLSDFCLHTRFLAELIELISGSGYEESFRKILIRQLYILSEQGIHAVKYSGFEPISDGIYSMHVTGKSFNIRILYCFLSNGKPAFLIPFFERGGKGKTDYSASLPVAIRRKTELEDSQYGR